MITLSDRKQNPRDLQILGIQDLEHAIPPEITFVVLHQDSPLMARNIRSILVRSSRERRCDILDVGGDGDTGPSRGPLDAPGLGNCLILVPGPEELQVLSTWGVLPGTGGPGIALLAGGPVTPGMLGMLQDLSGATGGLVITGGPVPAGIRRARTIQRCFACLVEALLVLGRDRDDQTPDLETGLAALADLAAALTDLAPGEVEPDACAGLAGKGLQAAWACRSGPHRHLEVFHDLSDRLAARLDRSAEQFAGILVPALLAMEADEAGLSHLARIMTRLWALEWGEDVVRVDEGTGRLSLLAGRLGVPGRGRDLGLAREAWEAALESLSAPTTLTARLRHCW